MRFHAPVVLPVSRLAGVTVHAQGMRLACRVGAALWIAGAQLLMAQSLAWSEVERMPRRTGFLACYDSWRERVVVIGGSPQTDPPERLWEWDGTQWAWRRSATPLAPADLGSDSSFAFDTVRGVAVLLTRTQVPGLHDRWEWNGVEWRVARQRQGPDPRSAWLLSSEPMLGGMFAFGGKGESWRFDDGTWRQLAPTVTPKIATWMAMTLDARRQRIVLLSGDETWEWDGVDWHARGPAGVVLTTGPRLVFDDVRNQVLMLVRDVSPAAFRIYAWDGSRWSRVNLSGPQPVFDHSVRVLPSPRGGILALGGFDAKLAGLWRLDGNGWQQLAEPAVALRASGFSVALVTAPARGSVLSYAMAMHNTVFELWEFRQGEWALRSAELPSLVPHGLMTWDERRRRLVTLRADSTMPPSNTATWEWDGAGWIKSAGPPIAVVRGAACFDAARGHALFVAQVDALTTVTLGWDGTTWIRFPNAATPGNLIGIAHDPTRGDTIAIGSDALTWRWDGQTWRRLGPQTAPAVWVFGGALLFDATRGQIVALALDSPQRVSAWNGSDWSVALLPPNPHAALAGISLAWDPASRRICMHGRFGPDADHVGTRTYLLTPQPAQAVPSGSPCGGITPPHLGVFAKPALGERMALELQSTRALAPAAFLLGTASANIPLGPCTLRVDPLQPLVAVPALTDMHGFTRLPLPIPYDLTLRGFTVHTQALLDDPLVPLTRIATSAGLTLRIGD